ncbi:MAG: hypothetical protein AB1633_12965 [Elusimicrobiota bacterium]
MSNEQELIQKAKAYVKTHYGEEVTHITVVENSVVNGKGTFIVDCAVKAAGEESRWRKTFTFEEDKAVYMTWKPLSDDLPTAQAPSN